MIEIYLAEVAEHLAQHRYPAADRLALALPHIAVALSHPDLHSSAEAYLAWCGSWVRPPQRESAYAQWFEGDRRGQGHYLDAMPFEALRALRLRRHLRAAALHANTPLVPEEPVEKAVHDRSLMLVAATLRWYEHLGRESPVVQSNLARVGVLR